MISKINTPLISTFNYSIDKKSKVQSNPSLNMDRVSFMGNSRMVSKPVFEMLQRLHTEAPIVGFKGDGKWLLPNLLSAAGQKFNLYSSDGAQLSYQKGGWDDNVIFTFKRNKLHEKTFSKIKLREVDEHLEFKKLIRTKAEDVVAFRVNVKDSVRGGITNKAGEVSKIIKNSDGSIKEFTKVSDEELKKINTLLENQLPYFF